MADKDSSVKLRIPLHLRKYLDNASTKRGMTLSSYVRMLIEKDMAQSKIFKK